MTDSAAGGTNRPRRATPYSFWLKASNFLEFTRDACEVRLSPGGFVVGPVGTVPYYVICMAIELGLKAFLLRRGLTVNDLRSRQFGHDLIALFDRCVQEGIEDRVGTVQPRVNEMIQLLSPVHQSRWLGYPEINTMATLPVFRDVLDWTAGMLEAIREDCEFRPEDREPG